MRDGSTPRADDRALRVTDFVLGRASGCAREVSGDVVCWGLLPSMSNRQLSVPINMHGWMPPSVGTAWTHLAPAGATRTTLPAGALVQIDDQVCVLGDAGIACTADYAHQRFVRDSMPRPEDRMVPSSGLGLCIAATDRVHCVRADGHDAEIRASRTRIEALAGTTDIVCALRSDHTVACLPRVDGTEIDVDHAGDDDAFRNVIQLVAGGDSIAMVKHDGTVWILRDNAHWAVGGIVPGPISGLHDVVEMSAGEGFVCARRMNGTIACWGENSAGQLGNGTTIDALVPQDVRVIDDAIALRSSDRHSCALRRDHSLWCWGESSLERLGTGAGRSIRGFATVELGDESVLGAAAGWGHTCALTARHHVWCWGLGYDGETGDDRLSSSHRVANVVDAARSTPRPRLVMESDAITSIRAFESRTCAMGDGVAWCWGNNDLSVIGGRALGSYESSDAPTIRDAWFARPVATDRAHAERATPRADPTSNARGEIAGGCGGDDYACAWTRDGRASCRRGNDARATTGIAREDRIEDLGFVVGMTCGSAHACAWTREGRLACWGADDYSQLSEPEALDSRVPHPVVVARSR